MLLGQILELKNCGWKPREVDFCQPLPWGVEFSPVETVPTRKWWQQKSNNGVYGLMCLRRTFTSNDYHGFDESGLECYPVRPMICHDEIGRRWGVVGKKIETWYVAVEMRLQRQQVTFISKEGVLVRSEFVAAQLTHEEVIARVGGKEKVTFV